MSSWTPTTSSLNATSHSSWINRKVVMAGTSFVQLLVQAFLIVILINSANGLYEDQTGKWDWRQTFVGRITNLLPLHLSPIPSVIVSTESNVVASISVRNGSLLWRSLLEERNLAEPKADSINLLSLDSEEVLYGLKDTAVPELHFITVSGNGRYVRKWSLRGVLIWEKSLPDDFVRSISGEQNVLFHVDHKRKHLHVVELQPPRVATFDLSRGDSSLSIIQSQSINSNDVFGNHIKSKDCIFSKDDVVVCIDSKSMSLKHINIIDRKITSYTLASIGLETSSTTSDLQLKLLQVSTTESLICLSLSSDGQVVLRITSGNISLVKILPKAVAVTVAPISLSGDYGAFVLISKPDDARQFKVACFNTRDWKEEMSLNDQFAIAEGTSSFVRSFWVLPFLKDKNLVKSYKILLLMEDDSFIQVSPSGGTNWIREESLASVSSVVFVDLPLSELDAQLDDESDNGFWVSPATILSNFVHRISTQITQLQTIARIAAQEIAILLDPSNAPASRLSLAAALGTSSDSMTRDYFGLHKLMVILTRPGKIIAMDTRGGDIIWSLVDNQLSQEVLKSSSDSQLSSSHKVSMFLQRTSSHAPLPAVCTIVTKSGFIFSFDPISGKVLDRKSTGQSVKQLMLMNHATYQHLKGIILQTSNNKVIVYPESASEELVNNKYFMMTADPATGTLEGFSINDKEADRVWTQKIPVDPKEAQPLVVYFKRHSEVVHSLGRVLGDRNVFYRYLNPNLVTVVTQRSEESTSSSPADKGSFGVVDVYLIDSVTGRIIHSTSHKRSRGPVFVVHSENSVIYNVYNEKARRTELAAIDLYEGLTQINASVFSSVDQGSWKPLVEQNSFIFPTGIRAMTDTVTEKGITNKHLMIALPSGGLLELPKAFLDPRRRFNLTMEHREEGIIQYIPELSIPSEGFVNYNQSLMKVKGIEVAPSGLESTCLVFAHGLDIFYTRVTPSKTFDILKDDFDHLLISGVLVILIALAYVSKWLSAQKSLKAAWT